MPPHVVSGCAACAGDIQNALDRPQPVGQSSTAPCGASHFATAREPSTMGAKSSVEKKSSPRRPNDMRPCAPIAWGAGAHIGSARTGRTGSLWLPHAA